MRISMLCFTSVLVLSLALCSCSKKQEIKPSAKPVASEGKKELNYMVCNRCGGSGRCQVCGGGGRSINGTCSVCDGSGRCFYCNGQGYY